MKPSEAMALGAIITSREGRPYYRSTNGVLYYYTEDHNAGHWVAPKGMGPEDLDAIVLTVGPFYDWSDVLNQSIQDVLNE